MLIAIGLFFYIGMTLFYLLAAFAGRMNYVFQIAFHWEARFRPEKYNKATLEQVRDMNKIDRKPGTLSHFFYKVALKKFNKMVRYDVETKNILTRERILSRIIVSIYGVKRINQR